MRCILPNQQEKPEYVRTMFNTIAPTYDVLNDLMSLFQHRLWKNKVVTLAEIQPQYRILDVCTGTGDLALNIALRYGKSVQVTGIDFSEDMLNIAWKRASHLNNIEFIQGDALQLPFQDELFDVVLMSFGLRNLQDISRGIQEMLRVTKKGGKVINLDLGKPQGIFWPCIFKAYFYGVVPLLGKLVHGHTTPYQYLPESMKTFPSPCEIMDFMERHGAGSTQNYNLAGGTVALQVAVK